MKQKFHFVKNTEWKYQMMSNLAHPNYSAGMQEQDDVIVTNWSSCTWKKNIYSYVVFNLKILAELQ